MTNRSYYSANVADFLAESESSIFGRLAEHHSFALDDLQKNAWLAQIRELRALLANASGFRGHLFFEFSIPRVGKRVDVVIVHRGVVFVLEFKVGENSYPRHALDQVTDYCLDLKNFHEGSHDKYLVPILISTRAAPAGNQFNISEDRVYAPLRANPDNLLDVISKVAGKVSEPEFDPIAWARSAYKPTPTIIEAAQALYQGHDVEDISRSDAGAINLSRTGAAISQIIDQSKKNGRKSICFISGVPGSGKTLAGLNIANQRHNTHEEEHAVFLSGNGPLVSVLQEALARDRLAQAAKLGKKIKKSEALAETKAFIQNIHHFRDDALQSDAAPIERVAVFDEAQRAWTLEQTAKFMKQKKGRPDFDMSEPDFLISVMDRHAGYAVIVCLIGGGQEINTGEAGMPEWFDALAKRYSNWTIHVSDKLQAFEYNRGADLYSKIDPSRLHTSPDLHLAVSLRSYRSEAVADWVKALLDIDIEIARSVFTRLKRDYPVVLTRNLESARRWLRRQARGTERFGIVASSGALRLKPLGLNAKAKIDPVNWFLNDAKDVRSAYYLEDMATEFDVQGLEVDWACVAWDGNFFPAKDDWVYRKFTGTKWQNISEDNQADRLYLKNAYRVLLTRARQGMVIFVPEGAAEDPTRAPSFYDPTFEYLRSIGIPVLE